MPPLPPFRIVLASTSLWRQQILVGAGIHVESTAPACDESAICPADPRQRALARAVAKAESVIAQNAIVIGCDQVCHLDGVVYSKPTDTDDHRRQLRALRAQTHTLSNGVSVRGPHLATDWVTDVFVTLRSDVSNEEIDAYIETGDAAGCCGGYRSEGLGATLIERIDGDMNAVVGMPLFELVGVLRKAGWRPAYQTNTSAPPPKVAQV